MGREPVGSVPRAYADATALIGLERIGRLDLLALLPTPTYVTDRVWEEAAGDPTKPGAAVLVEARAEGLLVVVEEGDPDAFLSSPRAERGHAGWTVGAGR